MNRYLGVDLHRNCFTVCTLKEDGQSELRKWSIYSLSEFAHTVQATDAVAVEATGNTRFFLPVLEGTGLSPGGGQSPAVPGDQPFGAEDGCA